MLSHRHRRNTCGDTIWHPGGRDAGRNERPRIHVALAHCSTALGSRSRQHSTRTSTHSAHWTRASLSGRRCPQVGSQFCQARGTDSRMASEPRCAHCSKVGPGLRLCSRCRAAHFCNAACQKANWKTHKKSCCIGTHLYAIDSCTHLHYRYVPRNYCPGAVLSPCHGLS